MSTLEKGQHEPLTVPSGFDGIDLVHFEEWTTDDDLPVDGQWSVTLAARNMAMQRCSFRSFHAAKHYASRISTLTDWTAFDPDLLRGEQGKALSADMKHAEAHAHEVDAVYPIGTVIPFSNGPSIVDDDGTTRQFLRGAPTIDWEKDEEGAHRCSVCGADPVVYFDWMDRS